MDNGADDFYRTMALNRRPLPSGHVQLIAPTLYTSAPVFGTGILRGEGSLSANAVVMRGALGTSAVSTSVI
jgi:hypothetical protein